MVWDGGEPAHRKTKKKTPRLTKQQMKKAILDEKRKEILSFTDFHQHKGDGPCTARICAINVDSLGANVVKFSDRPPTEDILMLSEVRCDVPRQMEVEETLKKYNFVWGDYYHQ